MDTARFVRKQKLKHGSFEANRLFEVEQINLSTSLRNIGVSIAPALSISKTLLRDAATRSRLEVPGGQRSRTW